MTYTFYKAQGIEIGNSLVEEDKGMDVIKSFFLKKQTASDLAQLTLKKPNAFADYTEVKDTEGRNGGSRLPWFGCGPKSIAKFDK